MAANRQRSIQRRTLAYVHVKNSIHVRLGGPTIVDWPPTLMFQPRM
jgi:hypothetical protein